MICNLQINVKILNKVCIHDRIIIGFIGDLEHKKKLKTLWGKVGARIFYKFPRHFLPPDFGFWLIIDRACKIGVYRDLFEFESE